MEYQYTAGHIRYCALHLPFHLHFMQHTYGHHNYTNVDGVDPDTKTNVSHCKEWEVEDIHCILYCRMLTSGG